MLHGIRFDPHLESALEEIALLSEAGRARYPKAVDTVTTGQVRLSTIFGFPAEHRIHLRPTRPIVLAFATIKTRNKKTQGGGTRKEGLAVAFKLTAAAENGWRSVDAPHPAAVVDASLEFPEGEGKMLTMDQDTDQPQGQKQG
jgi:transposase-like protein